jgi:hypothetical protein
VCAEVEETVFITETIFNVRLRDEAEEIASGTETVFRMRYELRLKKQLSIKYDRL